ncbi:MAG: hypothetical protein U0Y68_25060 [Blastocatellia bacterium]
MPKSSPHSKKKSNHGGMMEENNQPTEDGGILGLDVGTSRIVVGRALNRIRPNPN